MNGAKILIFAKVMNFFIFTQFTLSLVLFIIQQKFKIVRDQYEDHNFIIGKILQFCKILKIKKFCLKALEAAIDSVIFFLQAFLIVVDGFFEF